MCPMNISRHRFLLIILCSFVLQHLRIRKVQEERQGPNQRRRHNSMQRRPLHGKPMLRKSASSKIYTITHIDSWTTGLFTTLETLQAMVVDCCWDFIQHQRGGNTPNFSGARRNETIWTRNDYISRAKKWNFCWKTCFPCLAQVCWGMEAGWSCVRFIVLLLLSVTSRMICNDKIFACKEYVCARLWLLFIPEYCNLFTTCCSSNKQQITDAGKIECIGNCTAERCCLGGDVNVDGGTWSFPSFQGLPCGVFFFEKGHYSPGFAACRCHWRPGVMK